MKRLLVVEDEPTIRHLMCDILERAGYEVVCARSVAEAKAAEGPWDLLVIDRKLGDGDGLEIAALYPDVALLTVSGIFAADVPKPFTGRDLQAAVARKLGEAAPDEVDRRSFTRRYGDNSEDC